MRRRPILMEEEHHDFPDDKMGNLCEIQRATIQRKWVGAVRQGKQAMARSPHIQNLVRLTSGKSVEPGELMIVMGRLKALADLTPGSQPLLKRLYDLCMGIDTRKDKLVLRLIDEGIIEKNGKPLEWMQRVVVCALKENKAATIEIQMPYEQTESNIAALSEAAQHAVRKMGLMSLLRNPNLLRTESNHKHPHSR
jgi:hypothetical protein